MSKPRVSVIIPVYNAENTIGIILNKLIKQNYESIEVVVINDGSKDSSLSVIEGIARREKRIIVIDQDNRGASAARNAGIEASTGEFITFLDSDDDIDPMLIMELMAQTDDTSDFVMCGMYINGKKVVAPNIYLDNESDMLAYLLDSLLRRNQLYGPYCKLFRRSVVVGENILFPETISYGEDTIFVLSYLRHVRNISNLQKALYMYDYQQTGLAFKNSRNILFHRARTRALKSYLSGKELSLSDNVRYVLLRFRWIASYVKCVVLGAKNA